MNRLRRSLSLRTRLMLLSVLSAGVVLAIGGAVLLQALRINLIHDADEAAIDSARTIAVDVERNTLDPFISPADQVIDTAQVVRRGAVVSATKDAAGEVPLVRAPQQPGQLQILDRQRLPMVDAAGPFRVVALGVQSPFGPSTIYVAANVHDVEDVTQVAAGVGTIGAIVILTLLAVILWFVIGLTLRPVTLIRQRAQDISGQGLHRRVPVPRTQDEIAALAATINSMLDRIEVSVKRQDAFVADAAHELRTPLSTLRARLDIALPNASMTNRELLEDLLVDVARMAELVDHLLLLARSDAVLLSSRFEPVDLDDLAIRAAAAFDRPGIEVAATKVTPAQVMGNLALLEQILPNLLANASRFADHRIELSVQPIGNHVVLSVDDDGPGIPVEDRTRVFDRFVRLDQSRGRQTGGTGLGLAIVDQIVRMHGGRIAAQESPLGGARIRVELPVRPAPTENADLP